MKFTSSELKLASIANMELNFKHLLSKGEGYDVVLEPPADLVQLSMNSRVLNSGNWGYDFLNLDFLKSEYYDKGVIPERKILYVVIDTMAYPVHKALIPYSVDKKYCSDFTSDKDDIDGHGHGHHCAGIIMGQVAGSDLGAGHIQGYKSNDLFMGQKGLSSNGAGSSSWLRLALLKSMDICKTHFPDYTPVFSLSWSSGSKNKAITDAIDEIVANGGFVVAAAGNNGTAEVSWPAAHPNVLAIGSHDSNGKKSSFSQYGDEIFASAPGRNVWSTYKEDGQFVSWSGTSMATPHAAAMVGHVLKFNPQILSQKTLVEFLANKFKDAGAAGKDPYYGYGYPISDFILKEIGYKPEPPTEQPPVETPPTEEPAPVPKTRNKRKLTLDFDGSWDLLWKTNTASTEVTVEELNLMDKEVDSYNTLTLTDVKMEVETYLYFNDLYDWIEHSLKGFIRTTMHTPTTFDAMDVSEFFGKYIAIRLRSQYKIKAKVLEIKLRDQAGRQIEIDYNGGVF